MINYTVDIIIIAILLIFIFMFGAKGLVASLLKSFSLIISIGVTYILYPVVSGVIRQTFIFDILRESIYNIMGLETMAETSGAGQITAIESLTLPQGLKTMLVDNNNSVIYELLGVKNLQEYVAGYVANIILNIVTGILVFFVILFIIKIATATLNIAVKLPVVRQLNGLGGAVLGFVWGIAAIWTAMALSTLFIAAPFFSNMITAIDSSLLGKLLYDNNVIMNVLLAKLFGWG